MDLVRNVVDVYSAPSASGYGQQQRFERGTIAGSSMLPELTIPVNEILVG